MAIDCKFVKLFNDNFESSDQIINLEELNLAFDNGYIFEGEMIDICLTSSKTFGRDGTYVKLVKYENKYDCKFTFDFGSPNPKATNFENIIPDKKEYKYVDIKLFHTSVFPGLIVVKKYSNDVNNYKIN
jgi:hypothetical protein